MFINWICHTGSDFLETRKEILKTNILNQFLSTTSPVKIVFSSSEFTEVFLYSKSLCEMFVLKLSFIQISLNRNMKNYIDQLSLYKSGIRLGKFYLCSVCVVYNDVNFLFHKHWDLIKLDEIYYFCLALFSCSYGESLN